MVPEGWYSFEHSRHVCVGWKCSIWCHTMLFQLCAQGKMRLILGMCKRVAHNNILSWVGRCVSIFMHRSEEEEEGGHHKPSHGHQAPALSCQASVLPLVQVHCSSSSGHSFICSVDGCMESFHLVFRCSVEVSR